MNNSNKACCFNIDEFETSKKMIIDFINDKKELCECNVCFEQKKTWVDYEFCKICKKCILRMDHHCGCVSNCVGKNNHKFFILFLFYTSLALIIIILHISLEYI
jgi:palmitoyltransferase